MRSPDGDHDDPPADPAPDPEPDPSLVSEPDPKPEPDPEPKPEPEPEPEAKVEPLTVESLTVPDGFELQPELANKFLEILNNGEMAPGDRANALMALHAETINAAQEADSSAWDKMQTEWKDEVKADTDVGGQKLQPTLTNINKLIDEYGSKELKGVFDLTGAGNNVHMIKFLGKIADVLTEGKFFKAGSPGSGTDDPDAAAKRLYPSMKG